MTDQRFGRFQPMWFDELIFFLLSREERKKECKLKLLILGLEITFV